MNNEKLRQSIRLEVKKCLGEKLSPKPSVSLTESEKLEINEALINEGVGTAIVKTLGTLTGAKLGAALMSTFGAAIGATVGLIAPSVFLPVVAASAVGFGAYGLYAGGVEGFRIARRLSGATSAKMTAKLIEVTNNRDEVIKQLTNPDANKEKLSKKIDNLTNEQKKVGKQLMKELDYDLKKGLIDIKSHSVSHKIASKAAEGNLTYIGQK